MERLYTKRELEKLEDRYEFLFPVPYESNTLPDRFKEIRDVSFAVITNQLILDGFSLILCIPHLPVIKILKQAEVLSRSHSFRLLRIPSQNYNAAIKNFLMENSTDLKFFWIKDIQNFQVELPKTSYERIKLVSMNRNEVYSFWLEDRECTIAVWN